MEQLPLPLGFAIARGGEDFLVAPSNSQAVDWIRRWPDWPFATLIVAGPPGSGKTHLAGIWRNRAGARAVDLRLTDLEAAAGVAGAVRAVMIDDCDHAAGDREAELALLQLHNFMRSKQGHLLLTAATPPSKWGIALPDLASRLNAAMLAWLDPPDDGLLAAVAVKLFADRQLRVSPDVVPLIVNRGERSFAGIARTVEALDRASLSAGRDINASFAREVLARLEQTSLC